MATDTNLPNGMPRYYTLMIFFVVAQLHVYAKSLVDDPAWSTEEFHTRNREVTLRIHADGLLIVHYELSYNQLMKGITMYRQAKHFPHTIQETPLFEWKEKVTEV